MKTKTFLFLFVWMLASPQLFSLQPFSGQTKVIHQLVSKDPSIISYRLPETTNATLNGKEAHYSLLFNENKWTEKSLEQIPGTDYLLLHNTDAAFVHIEAEPIQYEWQDFYDQTIAYFSLEAPTVEFKTQKVMEINDQRFLFVELEINEEPSDYVYHIYTTTGSFGSIRLTFVAKKDYIEYFQKEFLEFARGILLNNK